MRINSGNWTKQLAKVLVFVMVMLSVMVAPVKEAEAAVAAPKISKTSRDILIRDTYDLNVINRIKGSTYTWTTSNKKIATVTKDGVVKGIKRGKATITCTVKAGKKVYKLVSKVNIILPAEVFRIKNKVQALNVGQTYDANRHILPAYSNDKTTWSSSDKTIAAPDKVGKFTALKEGTVTITAKAFGGKSDSMKIKVVDAAGTVATQAELDALLGSGVSVITIKTTEKVDFTIKQGKYTKTKLIVDAPNADVHNYGVFASIDIKSIAKNSWYEEAVGNLLNILASDSRIVVGKNSVVKIEVTAEGAKLVVENNGTIQEVKVQKPSDIAISGTSKQEIPVVINVPNIKITTSVPLNLDCNEKIELTLQKGAENTKVQVNDKANVPTIKGDITINVTVKSDSSSTGSTVVVTPAPSTPSGPSAPSTGGTDYSTVVKTINNDENYTTYTLAKPYTELKSILVTYNSKTYVIDSSLLATLKLFLANDASTVSLWKSIGTTPVTNTYGTGANAQTVSVSGTAGSSTKTVSFTGGQLDGKSYSCTVNLDNSITVVAASAPFTFTKVNDNMLKISTTNKDITFAPSF